MRFLHVLAAFPSLLLAKIQVHIPFDVTNDQPVRLQHYFNIFHLNFLLLEREIKLKVVLAECSILFSHVAQSVLCSVQLHELQDMGGSCSPLFETSAHQWDHWGHGSPKHKPNVSNAGRASMNSTCASGIQWLYDGRGAIRLMSMIIDTSIVKQIH